MNKAPFGFDRDNEIIPFLEVILEESTCLFKRGILSETQIRVKGTLENQMNKIPKEGRYSEIYRKELAIIETLSEELQSELENYSDLLLQAMEYEKKYGVPKQHKKTKAYAVAQELAELEA